MATDTELSEAALTFIEQSDNSRLDSLNPAIFGDRGRGYLFEYVDFVGKTLVIEWDPFVDAKGVLQESSWGGVEIEKFIGGIAFLAGIPTNDEEISKVVEIIKLYLPHIEG
jgi:hypothetical protein